MNIAGHQLSSTRHHQTLARVRDIAAPAAQLVERKLGGRIPNVDVIVAAPTSIRGLLLDAHRGVLGGRLHRRREDMRDYGTTTINTAGVLLIINADKCRRDAETDPTVIHEFGHALQLGRPGARDRLIRNLRNNYGIEVMPDAEAHAANRQVDADEVEAERLERLARKLTRLT